jgi:multidrug efflux pump subunit AcrA (membrane-fusion protein)
MSNNLIQIWFSYARQQLSGIANACLFINEHGSESFSIADCTSEDFSQSKHVLDNVKAVVNRRKPVVTTFATEQLWERKSSAVNSKSATVTDIKSKAYLVTAPLIVNQQLVGVVCFEFIQDRVSDSRDFLSQVESSIAWLSCLSQLSTGTSSQHAETVLKVTAMALSQSQSSEATMAVTSELASRLQCERVSIGFVKNHDVHVDAISNSAQHETRQKVVKCIEAAMQEAIEQQETLLFPPEPDSYYRTQEHDALVRQHMGEYVCTVPLIVNDEVIGAMMFERRGEVNAFDDKTKELCEQLASIISPILHYRRLNDRPISAKLRESGRSLLSGVFGSDYLGAKFISVLIVTAFVLMSFMHWDYRISADAMLEGEIERVITAPENGFIKDASARPGDIVEAGVALATLDDRDLQLEKLKWLGKQKQVSKEYREALALHDLSQIGILRAQLSQAEAQLEILEQKLSRTVIAAPISGVIVSGDYTRALGSPVERGQILYKVSPLDDYRIVLQVDESEISEITVGMLGEITLSAAAEDTFEIEVSKITPVSIAENGINYFQVEASLMTPPEFLRPGMQGVGKISVGERKVLWVATHKMLDWIRLKLWSWW